MQGFFLDVSVCNGSGLPATPLCFWIICSNPEVYQGNNRQLEVHEKIVFEPDTCVRSCIADGRGAVAGDGGRRIDSCRGAERVARPARRSGGHVPERRSARPLPHPPRPAAARSTGLRGASRAARPRPRGPCSRRRAQTRLNAQNQQRRRVLIPAAGK